MKKSAKELLGFVLASKIRRSILSSLDEQPMRPMELAQKIGAKQQNVSRCLFELADSDIVECLNPKNRAWRVYALTQKRKKISTKIK